MGVAPGDRGTSSIEFIETASVIEERTIDICRKWPKSWRFDLTNRVEQLASEIYEHAQYANCIIPSTEGERVERLIELERALGRTYAYSQKIELAYRKFPICGHKDNRSDEEEQRKSSDLLEELMNLCLKEEDSLKGNIHYTKTAPLRKPKEKEKDSGQEKKKK